MPLQYYCPKPSAHLYVGLCVFQWVCLRHMNISIAGILACLCARSACDHFSVQHKVH